MSMPVFGSVLRLRRAEPAPKVLYLVEGRQLGYGTKDVRNE